MWLTSLLITKHNLQPKLLLKLNVGKQACNFFNCIKNCLYKDGNEISLYNKRKYIHVNLKYNIVNFITIVNSCFT